MLSFQQSNTRIHQDHAVKGRFGEHQTDLPLLSLPLLFSEYIAALRLQTIIPKDCNPEAGRI